MPDTEDPDDYSQWTPVIDQIVSDEGSILVIGGTDVGKTTFCTRMVNAGVAAGSQVAVLDGDIGQSEIGPPACVGVGFPLQQIRAMSEIPASSLAFVGSNSPRGNLLEHLIAMRLQMDAAYARLPAPNLMIVDTTGYIQGAPAQRLKQAKIDLLQPRHIVVIQRQDECKPMLLPLKFRKAPVIHRLSVPASISRKTPVYRAQRRAAQFARYFENSERRTYDFNNVVLTHTWINAAPALAPHLQKFIANSLGVRVFHAELRDRHLGMVINSLPDGEQGLALVQDQFKAQGLSLTTANRLKSLLVGLCDSEGRFMGLGLIDALDFRRGEIGILTPIRSYAAVRLIQCGLLRIEASGKELGHNKPGEI